MATQLRTMTAAGRPTGVRLRNVALPNEHGAWGFWLEPVLLTLLVAPSAAGALIALGGLVAVFAQHPLSLVLADAARGRAYPRTGMALRVLAVELPIAGALVAGGVLLGGWAALAPLLLTAPLVLAQLGYERRNRGRDLAPELLGAMAMTALAPAILLAGGASAPVAITCWALLVGRNLSAVLYVRARLRLDRGAGSWRAVGGLPALIAAGTAALLAGAAVWMGLAPVVAAVLFAGLFGRAALGLSPLRRPVKKAKVIGISEMVLGALTALVLGLAWTI